MDGKRIRAFYANATAWSFDGDAEPHIVEARERQAAEFDAWLDRERAAARREGQAEGWECCANHVLASCTYTTSTAEEWRHTQMINDLCTVRDVANPYRNGVDQ